MGFPESGFVLPPDELRAYKKAIGGDPFPWHKGEKPLGYIPNDVRFSTDYQIAQFSSEDLRGYEFVSSSWSTEIVDSPAFDLVTKDLVPPRGLP